MSSKDHKAEKNLKISSIGEKQLIKRLLSQSRSLQPNSSFFDESSFKSLSDDSALIDLGDKYLVVTSDLLLESTHFPSDMSPYEKGAKVVTVNVSDLAAMGAQPLGFVLSWGLPPDLPLTDFDDILEGVLQSCQRYGMGLIGGDTNQSDELILSGTCLGIVDKELVLLKDGARPNDVVVVTGPLGVAAAGLEFLLSPPNIKTYLKKDLKPSTQKLITDHALRPQARLKEGIMLANTGKVTSATDITDGLASELGELVEASSTNVGITLFEDSIPILPEVEEAAAALDQNPLDMALYYGEDFELLLTVPPNDLEYLKKRVELYEVVVVTSSGCMEIIDKSGKTKILEPKGYQHLG